MYLSILFSCDTCIADIVNECDSAPCKNGGTCRDLLGAFTCNCTEEFSGKQCEIGKCFLHVSCVGNSLEYFQFFIYVPYYSRTD